jgi:hypothetical protein
VSEWRYDPEFGRPVFHWEDEFEYVRRNWADEYRELRYADELHHDREWLRRADDVRARDASEWFDQALTVALVVVVAVIVLALAWLSAHLIVLAARLVTS